jgi:hypothetical protein
MMLGSIVPSLADPMAGEIHARLSAAPARAVAH